LQAVRDEYLPLVSEDDVVVRHAPCRWVVFEGLLELACAEERHMCTDRVEQRAQDGQHDLLVGTRRYVRNGLDALHWKDTSRHVHGLARERQQKAQDLSPVALELFGRCHGRVAAYAALPYRIRDLVLAGHHLWQRKVGEEEEVDQRVDNFLGKWFRRLELGFALGGRLLWVGLVEDDLAPQLAAPAALSPGRPEELVLPLLEVVGFVQEREQSREDPYAVEGIALGRKLRVGEGGVVAQDNEARGDGEHERLEVG